MKRCMTVRLTRDDCRRGKQKSDKACPIARAMLRSGFTGISVGCMEISFFPPTDPRRRKRHGWMNLRFFETPAKVERFVERYDASHHPDRLAPISFRISWNVH